jgi:hypothetical protein
LRYALNVLARLLVLSLAANSAAAVEYHYLAGGESGRWSCEAAPSGWEQPEFDDAAWGEHPDMSVPVDASQAVPDGGHVPDGGAPPPCTDYHQRRRFDVGPEVGTLATLILRVRYQDGFVAWLNGVEVARRRLVPDAPLASELHGPERESIAVPVTQGLLRPTGNVLAIAVRPARPTRRAFADVAVDAADGPRLVRGPYLQRVSTSEGWLVLDTDLPTRVSLRYGLRRPRGASSLNFVDSGPAIHHELHLARLAPATAYHYRLVAHGTGDPASPSARPSEIEVEADFHTPPAGVHPLRFVVFGDVRSGHDVHAQLVRSIAAEDPDLVLLTGDMVDRGTDEGDWERFFDIEAPLLRQVAVYPAAGNHEYVSRGRGLERYLALFLRTQPTSWWSFDVAGVHFTILDSEAFANPDQLAWVGRDLAEARRRRPRAIFVLGHDGPYSSALHGDNKAAIHDYVPLFERYRVSMVFSGHDHDYERGRVGNTDYLVSGGGGAELRSPRCGVAGRKKCLPRVQAFVNEHHYVTVEVAGNHFRLCPKRADGTLLEPCPTLPLRR